MIYTIEYNMNLEASSDTDLTFKFTTDHAKLGIYLLFNFSVDYLLWSFLLHPHGIRCNPLHQVNKGGKAAHV